ncbi:DeoR/GlpR family DNA-binding transcription regulator [Streptomyces sp. RKAG293]|uniref:DeoR/GlpR family DNA-binding transcription regulator n=1 Tax=Streptomyces sp. RKAG293 TaxID=2893403 RepID=UPI002033C2CB|nr:DeoR/GlpR family DNA-binding transcription regulator [Streptomyces sp. RKAG293]MCM2422788.1 DeoR/GlpR family DNA-binding transcription regulator [Streptomyces sp. RKAG293]
MTTPSRNPESAHQSDRVTSILDQLAAKGSVSVDEVAREFSVSRATIRRDLRTLDEQNLLTRTHGGAVACDVAYELPVRYRNTRGRQQKMAIARAAVRTLPSGPYVVAVSGGTTTSEVARLLASRTELTVVTNALNIAMELVTRPRVKLVVTGGVARLKSYELVGPWAERTLGGINVGTAFVGVDGISAEAGISTHDEIEAHINAVMISRARRVVVVADGSKVGRKLLAHVAALTAVDELITDSGADPAELDAVRDQGVRVTVADLPAR